MKKFFSLFAALLFAGSMMATDVEITPDNCGWATTAAAQSGTVSGVTVAVSNGLTGTDSNGATMRIYKDATLTVSVASGNITKIVLNCAANNKTKYGPGCFGAQEGYSYEGKVGTWTGSAKNVEFTASGAQVRATSIVVTYEVGAEVAATAIELDQTALTIKEGATATLKATLTPANATTAVTWESSDEAVATVAAGKVTAKAAGTATITAKAGTLSATCAVTVEAAPLMTCAEASALAKDGIAKLGEVVVTYVNGSNTYVKDATGGALIYANNFGLKAGDVVKGFIGKSSPYNGLPELVPTVTLADLTVVAGEAPAPEELADAPVAADVNKYVVLKGVSAKGTFTTSSKTTITVTFNEKSVAIYNNFKIAYEFDEAKSYDIVGAVSIYNGNVQVYFISATEQEEPVDPDQPSVTATSEEFEITAEGFEGNTVTLEYANLGETFVVEATADAEATWITNIALSADKSELTFDVAANDGAARTATITVTATAGETVATATITVSQAAYVAPVTGDYFAKVTATADITDGAYLIVYEGNDSHDAVAFNGSLETLDAVNNGLAVTIAENKIAATEALLAAVFTLDKTAGTLKSASGLYIGKTANANGLDAKADTEYTNTFAIDEDGNAVITASGNCTLRYNYASDQLRFRYYKSGQQAVALYKLVKEQGPATALTNTAVETKAVKTLRNGILVIEKAGVRYNVMGQAIR